MPSEHSRTSLYTHFVPWNQKNSNIDALKIILILNRVICSFRCVVHLCTFSSSGRKKLFWPTRYLSLYKFNDQWRERKIAPKLLIIFLFTWISIHPPGLTIRSISTAKSIMSHLNNTNFQVINGWRKSVTELTHWIQ